MNRIVKSLLFSFAMSLTVCNCFALESEFKNSLSKIELKKVNDEVYNIDLYTQKKFCEPIRVIKKNDLSYYILLPETQNSNASINSNSLDIKNVSASMFPYALQDAQNGYTKINIITTKPLNFNVNVKNLSERQTTIQYPNQNKKIASANKAEIQKKNLNTIKKSDFSQVALAAKIPIAKKENIQTTQVKKQAQEIKEQVQNIAEKQVQITKEVKKEIQKISQKETISNPNEIIEKVQSDTINNNNEQKLDKIEENTNLKNEIQDIVENNNEIFENKQETIKEEIQKKDFKYFLLKLKQKMCDFGINNIFIMFLICFVGSIFILFLLLISKKPKQKVGLAKKTDFVEKPNKPKGKQTSNGQYFVFDNNVKQSGFCNPVSEVYSEKRKYELTSYDPDIQKNKSFKTQSDSEMQDYEIIQKILREDSFVDLSPKDSNVPLEFDKKEKIRLEKIQKERQLKEKEQKLVQATQDKPKETALKKDIPTKNIKQSEPIVLSNVEISQERGFMCVSFENNISLMGYIYDEVFLLHNFNAQKLENYEIKYRLSDRDDKTTDFIVKVANTKMVIKVYPNSMKTQVVM